MVDAYNFAADTAEELMSELSDGVLQDLCVDAANEFYDDMRADLFALVSEAVSSYSSAEAIYAKITTVATEEGVSTIEFLGNLSLTITGVM